MNYEFISNLTLPTLISYKNLEIVLSLKKLGGNIYFLFGIWTKTETLAHTHVTPQTQWENTKKTSMYTTLMSTSHHRCPTIFKRKESVANHKQTYWNILTGWSVQKEQNTLQPPLIWCTQCKKDFSLQKNLDETN